ncbi:MAG: biotin carboxylase N-terminal domain-containing protein [Alphaproteobacteria bacterium]
MRKLLIANRGEIALRIMRTARAMGIKTVAIYSDADAGELHVRAADEAIRIGGPRPQDSYLDIDAIVAAAKASGAEALHPGYGFLAENARFAEACTAAGLMFVGPPATAIAAMGNKAAAKRLMLNAGVACVPGYEGVDHADATLTTEAARIGYPVMIKAAAGGGGRGMRRVDRAEDFTAALSSARSEAKAAFGDDQLILERAIVEPRHVEIQVFADTHRGIVHMGERDCSVQRRHQKLVEETPAPGMTDDLRRRMGAAAIDAARAVNYVGAGTVEFLLDRDANFYFMEMNTRLQVEHGVTEAVTGIDLVEWQILIARGEPLPFDQDYFDGLFGRRGHAIEVRLCAEDPARDFMPQSGAVALWRAPGGARCDAALESGGAVSPYYDSMVAKLIAVGQSRGEAIDRMIAALDDTVLLGVATNRTFLRACLDNAAFRAGAISTGFIANHAPQIKRAPANAADVCVAGLLRQVQAEHAFAGPAELRGWLSNSDFASIWRFDDGVARHVVEMRRRGTGVYEAVSDQSRIRYEHVAVDGNRLSYRMEDFERQTRFAVAGNDVWFAFADGDRHFVDATWDTARGRGAGGADGRVLAQVNGRIVNVAVAVGDTVAAGQRLLSIESMKIEQIVAAPTAGTIKTIAAKPNDQVAPGKLLIELEPVAQSGKQEGA